jgi:hypothetical protein
VLSAVLDGRLARPDHVIDLVHPPTSPPRVANPTPAVRLLPKEGASPVAVATESVPARPTVPNPEPVSTEPAPSEPAKNVSVTSKIFEPESEVPETPETDREATKAEAAVRSEPAPPEPTDKKDALPKRDITHALFEGIEDPSTPESAFFATKPQLQRF